jgi:hypothetical protein
MNTMDMYMHEDSAPTAAQLSLWASVGATWAANKAAGQINNGRDWSGVLVQHADNCVCNGCVSDAVWEECKAACGLPKDSRKPLRDLVVNTEVPHLSSECPGRCMKHPLLDAAALAFREQEDLGKTWGDIAEADYLAERAAETPKEREARLKKEAAAEAAALAGIVRYSTGKKADKWCAKGGAMKFRVPKPCRYEDLFAKRVCAGCSATVPVGQTTCQAKKDHGRVCGEVLAGCWSHSKGQCIYVHPDEAQWNDAVSGALCYDREAQRFFLKGEEPVCAARDFSALGFGARSGVCSHPPRNEQRRGGGRR